MSAALRRSFSSLEIPNYRRYFAGQLVSLSGNWVQIVAEMWLILELTGSALAAGFTAALQFLPMLLFGAWGGVLADRWPKRRLLIATQTAMIAPALALWGLTGAGAIEPWMVFVLVFARGAVNAIDNPTRQSFVVEMVGTDRVVNAVGLNSVLIHSARIVGPAVAGAMIALVGIATCFLINAFSFAAMIVALRGMDQRRLAEPPEPRGDGGVLAALRYVRGEPRLLVPLAMMALVGTLAFNFQVILPLLARFAYDGGATAYSALAIAMAAGSIIGALVTGARTRVSQHLIVGAALGFGVLALIAAAAPTLPVAIALLVPLGTFTVIFAASINSSLQLDTAPHMRGRVMALYSVVFLGSTPIGGPIVGALSELAGARAGLVLGGVAALVAAAGGAYAFARRRDEEWRLPGLGGRWSRGLRARWPLPVEAGGADQLHRLQRRGGLDVEAHSVALLDRGHRSLPGAPGERDQDRVAGADRRDLRPNPPGGANADREGEDRPQTPERDPAWALGGQAGRRARPGEHARHGLRRPHRAPEPHPDRRCAEPPRRADGECRRVGVAVGDDDGHRAERGGDAAHQQHGHAQQVAEQH
jgi:MFS family permease